MRVLGVLCLVAAVTAISDMAVLESLRHVPEEEMRMDSLVDQIIRPLGTSTFHTGRLAVEEVGYAATLSNMAATLTRTADVLNRYLKSWSELVAAGVDEEDFAINPFHAYALVKHVSLGWPHVLAALGELNNVSQVAEEVSGRRGLPGHEDLAIISGGLARLHDYYTLNLTALTQAQFVTRKHPNPLPVNKVPSARDLHRIGSEAMSHNVFNSAVDFLQAAVDAWDPEDANTTDFDTQPDLSAVKQQHKKAVRYHDQVLEKKGSRTDLHSTNTRPFNSTLARKKKYHKPLEITLDPSENTPQNLKQYLKLCRGENFMPVNVSSRLYCRYVTNGSPLYVIGPLKMTVVSLDPYVVTIDDILSEGEARDVVNASGKFLERSSTKKHNGQMDKTFIRTSSTAWMLNRDSRALPALEARMHHLTGMEVQLGKSSEMYQVVNYGIGGHYTPHHDVLPITPFFFQRLATFLIYLTDVQQGGDTVFPFLGVGVAPRRGRALLWYNTYTSSIVDKRVNHGACPVMYGDKWIITKWIYTGPQFRVLPCTGDAKSIHAKPLV